jgi:AAA family ATP:ADP antiporter
VKSWFPEFRRSGIRAVARSLGLEPDEVGLAGLMFGFFMLVTASHFAAKSVRQAWYLGTLGAERLPFVYLLVAVAAVPSLVAYRRLAAKFPTVSLIVGTCVAQAAGLLAVEVVLPRPSATAAILFYVWTTLIFGIAVSQLWAWATEIFHARQARRLFAFISAGGLLGGIPGGFMAGWAARRFGAAGALNVAVVLVLTAAVVAIVISRIVPTQTERSSDRSTSLDTSRVVAAFRRSPLLKSIAGLMALSAVLAQVVDLQFYWVVERVTTGLDERTGLIGNFFVWLGILAFLFQVLFTRRIHRSLGTVVGLRVLPAWILAASVLFAVALLSAPGLLLAAVWTLKLGENGFRHSVDQASRELLFVPVPLGRRRDAKVFIDVFVQRAAEGVAGLILLPVLFGVVTIGQVTAATVVLCLVWLRATIITQERYISAFRDSLRSVPDTDAGVDLGNAATLSAVLENMGSTDPRRCRHAISILADNGRVSLIPPVMALHPDASVRATALEALAASGRDDLVSYVGQSAMDDDPAVRSAALKALALLGGDHSLAFAEKGLEDPEPKARAAAAAALLGSEAPALAERAMGLLKTMAEDRRVSIRVAVAEGLGHVGDPLGTDLLMMLLYDPHRTVVRAAIAGVRRRMERWEVNPLYLPRLIAVMGNRRIRKAAREALIAAREGAIPALELFMTSEDEDIRVRRAVPRTLARIGSVSAADALSEHMEVGDLWLRSEVFAGLGSLRRRAAGINVTRRRIALALEVEIREYRELRGYLDTLASEPDLASSPMADMLRSRLVALADNAFLLLELVLRPTDVHAARRGVRSGSVDQRAKAVEFLENALEGRIRKAVMSLVTVAEAEPGSRIDARTTVDAVIDRLVGCDLTRDPSQVGLVCTAMHAAVRRRRVFARERIRTLHDDEESPELVRDTARWALARLEPETAPLGAVEEVSVTALATIEIMSFLQQVDLFGFLGAEETLRLAAVASERRVPSGEVIFRRDEPSDVLYCVVDGRVRLEGLPTGDTEVGPEGRFGVLDILSGRRRQATATAVEDTRLVAIEAEDFFDVLADDIGIVRALFHKVVEMAEGNGLV